jgi:hypothetical protein
MTEKKANHQANIVRLGEPRVHTNADKLELFDIGGYQVVTQKGQFKAGDLAVYIQPDSVVPQTEAFRFIWGPYCTEAQVTDDLRNRVEASGQSLPPETAKLQEIVSASRRRITVRKFRKEWSEGLLLPVSDFSGGLEHEPKLNYGWLQEGEDVSDILGITHYEPEIDAASTKGDNMHAPRRRYPKTLKGWFYFLVHKFGLGGNTSLNEEVSFDVPKYDIESIKNYSSAFEDGEEVIATEKIHGSQARYVFLDSKMYAGSRNFWKAEKSQCVWRRVLALNPWIEEWCRAHEGYTLYGEVTPTQKGFSYGNKQNEARLFVFDIRTPDGLFLSKESTLGGFVPIEHTVPVIYTGPFNLETMKKLSDGPSLVKGANHIREGIVISPKIGRIVRGVGRLILKLVSNAFLDKDSK